MYNAKKLTVLMVATLSVLQQASCQWYWGACPDVQLQEPFDITRYVGKWYEYARDKATFYEKGECVQAKYTLQTDRTIQVRNMQ